MQALFKLEADIRGQTADERKTARTLHAVPLLDELKEAMESALAGGSKKSSLSQAIRYALTRWPALIRYTTDGRLDMTNNAAERAIRPVAIGRKNWTFAGSDDGGRRAAVMYTSSNPPSSMPSTPKPISAPSSLASPSTRCANPRALALEYKSLLSIR